MRSVPDWVFGKAITSRMLSSPARIATSRSRPTAKPAVRRRAVAERPEQEAEALLGLLVGDAERLEDAALDVRAVDPDAPRTELPAVQDEVVATARGPRSGSVSMSVEVLGRAAS